MTGWRDLRVHVARLRRRDDLADLTRRGVGGDVFDIDVEVEASDLAISTSRIVDGTPIRVSGSLEAGLNDLPLHAHVATTAVGECRRCLEPVTQPLELDVDAIFVEGAGPDSDTYPIEGDWVDVGTVVREELMLALPLSPLCEDDCAGSDPDRFPTARAEMPEPDEGTAEVDPRWAALSQLTFDED